MDEATPLTEIPLTTSNERRQHLDPHLDTTYGRYERAPFRQYSDRRVQNQAPLVQRPRRMQSQDSLLRRLLSRQSRLERTVQSTMGRHGSRKSVSHSQSGVSRKLSKNRPQPSYTLAGPRPPPPAQVEAEYDDGEADDARPQPNWGLAKPFPHLNRRGRKSKKRGGTQRSSTGHPEGQVGGGPGGHHHSPVRGQAIGEASGGPAANARNPEDEDEGGHTNYLEHFADWDNDGEMQRRRKDSEETLTEEGQDDDDDDDKTPNWWFSIRRKIREPLAEWLGTMVAVLMGTAGNLQVKTSQGQAGSFTQEAAMWGLGTMMSIYIAGGISGAHCNPSVSILLSVFRGFPARKAAIYIVAQCIGAICAVLIAYGIYKDAIMDFDPHKTSGTSGSGKAFFTLPASFATPITAFFTDFTSAAVMSVTILALGDDDNAPPGAGMHAFILGLIGFAMASTLGYNTGPQTNPAKDLATRLVPYWVGYGSPMWARGWWAEAWAASIFGGLFGALIYDVALFEGLESPINYPRKKREMSRMGNRRKWWKTGLFGKEKKTRGKVDLENGVGILEKGAGRQMDGH